MRRYRPFLVYNPGKGWGFYHNRNASPLTAKNIGDARKTMRRLVGWFPTAEIAAMFERTAQNIANP